MLEPTHKTLLAILNSSNPENTVWDANFDFLGTPCHTVFSWGDA